jgi:6-phosphogluconolactonase
VTIPVEVRPIDELPDACAARIADDLRAAVDGRGRAVLALSGGKTPIPMFAELAAIDLPWGRIEVVQVDERVAPDGDPERNLTAIESAFVENGPLPASNLHPMDVTADDLGEAAARYCQLLDRLAPSAEGGPPVIDVVQLGIGPDGHTASLVPGDAVLDVNDRWVAVTEPYQGLRRLTLTYPVLDAAHSVVWMIEGEDRASALARLEAGDTQIPASRVESRRAVVVCDPTAAAAVEEPG